MALSPRKAAPFVIAALTTAAGLAVLGLCVRVPQVLEVFHGGPMTCEQYIERYDLAIAAVVPVLVLVVVGAVAQVHQQRVHRLLTLAITVAICSTGLGHCLALINDLDPATSVYETCTENMRFKTRHREYLRD